jgi:hypothetical protein
MKFKNLFITGGAGYFKGIIASSTTQYNVKSFDVTEDTIAEPIVDYTKYKILF